MRTKFVSEDSDIDSGKAASRSLISFIAGATLSVLTMLAIASPSSLAQAAASERSEPVQSGASAQMFSLSGQVSADDGRRVSYAAVTLTPVSGAPGAYERKTTTDRAGRFQATGLADVPYTVKTDFEGYIPSNEKESSVLHRPGDFVAVTMTKGGVITGRVTNSDGEPLVRIEVRATLVRTSAGEKIGGRPENEAVTDDRGIYRMYGLEGGLYLVAAAAPAYAGNSPGSNDSPTYYPSSAWAAASPVSVAPGSETTAIDIRFRGEPGYSVSGRFSGAFPGASQRSNFVYVDLADTATGFLQDADSIWLGDDNRFEFRGVPNGEYIVKARYRTDKGVLLVSAAVNARVKGADIGGLGLKLAPLGSIKGRLTVVPTASEETMPRSRAKLSLSEVAVFARHLTPPGGTTAESLPTSLDWMASDQATSATPGSDGHFEIRNIEPGSYRIEVELPAGWRLKSVQVNPDAGAAHRRIPTVKRGGVPPPPEPIVEMNGAASIGGVAIEVERAKGDPDSKSRQIQPHK